MLQITLCASLLWSFWNITKYLTYTTIACRLCFSQSVTRSNSFDWQNTQEKDNRVITAHESTTQLTLALGIYKFRRISSNYLAFFVKKDNNVQLASLYTWKDPANAYPEIPKTLPLAYHLNMSWIDWWPCYC
jgi:hypothetical protein